MEKKAAGPARLVLEEFSRRAFLLVEMSELMARRGEG